MELKQQGLTTYEIRGNSNYRDLVASIDSKDVVKHMSLPKGPHQKDELIKLTEVEFLASTTANDHRINMGDSDAKKERISEFHPRPSKKGEL